MSTNQNTTEARPERKPKPKRINVRTPEVMERVQAEVEEHYRSQIVEKIRSLGGEIRVSNTTVRLAREFGFCYGVERAIDLAYATRKVFADRDIYLIGEIIHNPEVNRQLAEMGIERVGKEEPDKRYDELESGDVVIVPAFGAETDVMNELRDRGCTVVDTTCGDVMKVWRRVRENAKKGYTSIIHGKAEHEETRATASRAVGDTGGHYLVVLTMEDADYLSDYIRGNEGGAEEFFRRFEGAMSEGFDPDQHLTRIGVANQTTMLQSETEEIQQKLRKAVIERDGGDENFQSFDTICGATQERQDALYKMLEKPLDLLLVVGGYNSSNTSHLVEIGEKKLPTFFIRNAECLKSLDEIIHFDLAQKAETSTSGYAPKMVQGEEITIGITAGASCPNNLIEETLIRVFELRGISTEEVQNA